MNQPSSHTPIENLDTTYVVSGRWSFEKRASFCSRMYRRGQVTFRHETFTADWEGI